MFFFQATFDTAAQETLNRHRCDLGDAYKIAEGCLLLEFLLSKSLILSDEEDLILAEKSNQLRMGMLIDTMNRRMTGPRFKIVLDAVGNVEVVNNPGLKKVLVEYYKKEGGTFDLD